MSWKNMSCKALVLGFGYGSDEEEEATVEVEAEEAAEEAKKAVPKGFFDDADKNSKARGEKVKKLTAAEELEQFEKSVKADIAEAGGCFRTSTRPTFNLQR